MEPVAMEAWDHGVYSHYLTVSQKDGSLRPIMDFRILKDFLAYCKFRKTLLYSILPLLMEGTWIAITELQDAFFILNIQSSHSQYLRFVVENQFQYKVFPFEILTVP